MLLSESIWLLSLLSPAGPTVDPVPGACCVWADSHHMLRFCSSTDSLILTVRQGSSSCPQDAIMVLRDRLGDHNILKLVRADATALFESLLKSQLLFSVATAVEISEFTQVLFRLV